MEQQTSVTTTTSTNVLSIQSSQQDTIVESTCAALISQAAAAAIGSSSSGSGATVIPPALSVLGAVTTGVASAGGGSISSNISEVATGGSGVLKNILKTSAPVSPATVSNPPGKIFGRNNNGTSKCFLIYLIILCLRFYPIERIFVTQSRILLFLKHL